MQTRLCWHHHSSTHPRKAIFEQISCHTAPFKVDELMCFGKGNKVAKHSTEEQPNLGTPPADRDKLAVINQQLLSDSRCAQVRPERAVKPHVRKGEGEPVSMAIPFQTGFDVQR